MGPDIADYEKLAEVASTGSGDNAVLVQNFCVIIGETCFYLSQ